MWVSFGARGKGWLIGKASEKDEDEQGGRAKMEPESQPGSSAHPSPSLLPPPSYPIQREDEDILSLSSSLWTVFARWVMVMRGGVGLEGGV